MKKILLFTTFLFCFFMAWAEVSPLPEAQFTFLYPSQTSHLLKDSATELLLCKDRLCLEQTPLGSYGSQRMNCNEQTCTAVAYDFAPFSRLVSTFEDGTSVSSNVFSIDEDLINQFNVYVGPQSLYIVPAENQVQEPLWKRPQAWGALSLILILELLCATAWIWYTKKRFTILYGVAIANVLTAALTWGILVHYVAQSAIWWIACVALETLLVRFINYKDISLKDSATLCIMTNVTSYTLGMIISFMWAQL